MKHVLLLASYTALKTVSDRVNGLQHALSPNTHWHSRRTHITSNSHSQKCTDILTSLSLETWMLSFSAVRSKNRRSIHH